MWRAAAPHSLGGARVVGERTQGHISRLPKGSLLRVDLEICQIQLNSFGVIDEKKQLPEDSEILKRGLAILIPIAEKFAKNEIGREELFPYRNREMQRLSAKEMISLKNV